MSQEKKLNIGLFIDTFHPMIDGVITVVDNYARKLNQTANVTVFAPRVGKNYDDSTLPYKVVRCKSLKFIGLDYDIPLPNLDKEFKKAIKEATLDIVHIHSPFYIGSMGAKYGRKNNIPVIATLHSQFKRDFYKATKSKLITKILLKTNVARTFNKADLLLTMNPACEKLSHEYGYKGRVKLLPNGTNLLPNEEIYKLSDQLKEKYCANKEKIFISIGRLNKLKNIDLVLDTMHCLKEQNFNFKLLLLGSGKDEKYFRDKTSRLGLENNVVFVGRVSDANLKGAYFNIADLHIFPSFYDTDGIVRIEAAAFNTPTIFIKDSIASSACTDGINGYIGENDKQTFARKIIDIFSDAENYDKVCKQSKPDLYITWEQVVEKLQKIYHSVIKEKKND